LVKAGWHPALVVQNDIGNAVNPMTIVVPLTDMSQYKGLPVQVHLSSAETGLPHKDSCVECGHVMTVDRAAQIDDERAWSAAFLLMHSTRSTALCEEPSHSENTERNMGMCNYKNCHQDVEHYCIECRDGYCSVHGNWRNRRFLCLYHYAPATEDDGDNEK
jgi:hypothetical protein